jgi:hypothetical protein
MPSQTHSLDATALTLILFLAIYLYIRVTVVWIASLSNRYADRDARQATAPPTEELIEAVSAGPEPDGQ